MGYSTPLKIMLLKENPDMEILRKFYDKDVKNSGKSFATATFYTEEGYNCVDAMFWKCTANWPPKKPVLYHFTGEKELSPTNSQGIEVMVESLESLVNEVLEMRKCHDVSEYMSKNWHRKSGSLVYDRDNYHMLFFSPTLKTSSIADRNVLAGRKVT